MNIGLSLGLAVCLGAITLADTGATMPPQAELCRRRAPRARLATVGAERFVASRGRRHRTPLSSTVADHGTVTLQYGPATDVGSTSGQQQFTCGEKGFRWTGGSSPSHCSTNNARREGTIVRWGGKRFPKFGNSGGLSVCRRSRTVDMPTQRQTVSCLLLRRAPVARAAPIRLHDRNRHNLDVPHLCIITIDIASGTGRMVSHQL